MSLSGIESLLVRIQSKIESRTRRPWFDLQRSYFFKDRFGVKTVLELRKALEHFHVLLADNEYELLFNSFLSQQAPQPTFDFKAFASRLYPKESNIEVVRDGRLIESIPVNYNQTNNNVNNNPMSHNPHNHQHYANDYHNDNTINNQNSNNNNSVFQSTGSSIITSGAEVPRLGETLGPQGTTAFYQNYQNYGDSTSNGNTLGKSKSKKNKSKSHNFVPRLTYNRAHHQRYNETEYEDYRSGLPTEQNYPIEEFKPHGAYQTTLGHPRFETKNFKNFPTVEVARRYNISRQYNTLTGKNTQ